LSTAAPGTVTGSDVLAQVASAAGLTQGQPNMAAVGSSVFLAWWTDAAPRDPNGQETWVKSLSWSDTALNTNAAEIPLPRWTQARIGDQRSPAGGERVAAGWCACLGMGRSGPNDRRGRRYD
jgi:hypothetical protein